MHGIEHTKFSWISFTSVDAAGNTGLFASAHPLFLILIEIMICSREVQIRVSGETSVFGGVRTSLVLFSNSSWMLGK